MRPVLDGPHHDAPLSGLDAQPIGGRWRRGLVVRALSAAASKVRCGQEHEHAESTPAAHVQQERQAGFASAAVAADAQVARGRELLEERRAELELFAAPPPAKRLCARLAGDEGGVGARRVTDFRGHLVCERFTVALTRAVLARLIKSFCLTLNAVK